MQDMTTEFRSKFDDFAQRFVREYWGVVKNGIFPMPPNEPVEEPLDEILAQVSYETELGEEKGTSLILADQPMANQ